MSFRVSTLRKVSLMSPDSLINRMRAAGMQPIVVYDVQGTRHWKAKEQARREAKRSLSLSRSLHEARRQTRLQQIIEGVREAMERMEIGSDSNRLEATGPEREGAAKADGSRPEEVDEGQQTAEQPNKFNEDDIQEAAGQKLQTASSIEHPDSATPSEKAASPVDRPDDTRTPERAASPAEIAIDRSKTVTSAEEAHDIRPSGSSQPATGTTNAKIESLSAVLASLQEQLASESRPPQRKALRSKLQAAADVVTGREAAASDLDAELIEEDESFEVQPIEPSSDYTETPRQVKLTVDEGVMLEDALRGLSVDAEDLPGELGRLHMSALGLAAFAQSVAITYDTSLSTPSAEDHRQTRELLEVMGVPLLEAEPPYEAEGVASAMAAAGLVDYVGTEDTDVLAYQAPLLRNVATNDRPLEIVDGTRLRSEIGLDFASFIDWILLCGTDATSRIYRVGNHKALKLIQESGSIEEILDKRPQLRTLAGEEYYHDVLLGRQVFGELPPIPSIDLTQRPVSSADVQAYLHRVHGISVEAGEISVDELDDAYHILESPPEVNISDEDLLSIMK